MLKSLNPSRSNSPGSELRSTPDPDTRSSRSLSMRVLLSIVFGLPALTFASESQAALIQANQYSSDQNAYSGNVSNSDLLHSLAGTHSGFSILLTTHPDKLNDGLHGVGATFDGIAWVSETGATSTFNLGTGPNSLGWNLTSIESIASWSSANFHNQNFDILVRKVGDAGYTLLHSMIYEPGGNVGSTRISLTDSNGFVATNVEFIRFQFYKAAGTPPNSGSTTYREIDVHGVAAVPEPATAILMLMGGIWAAVRYRRHRR